MTATYPSGKIRRYAPGEILIQEGEISRRLFFIRQGSVAVFKTHMGQKVVLSTLNKGELFGEISFIESTPRSASVEAVTPVEVLVIESSDVEEQFQKIPEWILPIFKTVFQRLRMADQRTLGVFGMKAFERRHFKKDATTKSLFHDIQRANRFLQLLVDSRTLHKQTLRRDELSQLYAEILGPSPVQLNAYMNILKLRELIDAGEYDNNNAVILRRDEFDEWTNALSEEITTDRYMLLSTEAFKGLKAIYLYLMEKPQNLNTDSSIEIPLFDPNSPNLTPSQISTAALKELHRFGVLKSEDDGFLRFSSQALIRSYGCQNVLRCFWYKH
jgi:CRP/FNR family transcriptional regulator